MRMRTLIASALIAAASLTLTAPSALAAGKAKEPKQIEWAHGGPFGMFDRSALQRGFQVYKEVCSTCHTMEHLRYRNLGEAGGPFQMVAPRGWDKEGVTPVFGNPGHGKEIVNANDNPAVRAIAAQYQITEIDRQSGQEVERPGRPSDKFVSPYTNPFQPAALHGIAPPDLSVITRARKDGENYLYSLLTGYDPNHEGEPPGGATNLHYNPYFPGGWIAMGQPIQDGQITYADGSPETVSQYAKDVTTFLAWAADPTAEQRKSLGFQVLIYLLILTLLLYVAYKQVWRNEKH